MHPYLDHVKHDATATETMVKIETREVLADAYPRRRKSQTHLTHSVEIDEAAREHLRVLCNRVDLESICDGGSLDPGDEQKPPTCPRCRAKDPRFLKCANEPA